MTETRDDTAVRQLPSATEPACRHDKLGRSHALLHRAAACCLAIAALAFALALIGGWRGTTDQRKPSAVLLSADRPLPEFARLTKNIDQIQVGERVWADNPTGTHDLSFGEDVDPASWRRLLLRSIKTDGVGVDAVLLRPMSWIEQNRAHIGGVIDITVLECGINGKAEVLDIGPCPPIKQGPGRVVTGTFAHSSGHVVDLHVERLDEPIGTTGNHLFWSEDRRTFVRADELRIGERLRTTDGTIRVRDLIRRRGSEPVYNLEVQCDHVYHVTSDGILVHNGTELSQADIDRLNRPGYTNYRLQTWDPVTKQWRTYYHGMHHQEPLPHLQSRHAKTHGFDPKTDRIVEDTTLRRYGDARLEERSRILADGTNAGRGNPHQPFARNHSNGIDPERLKVYEAWRAQCRR